MNKLNIGILTACESDHHLSKPVYDELMKIGMQSYFITLTQNNIIDSYHKANFYFRNHKYDFVLAVGDRKEQIGAVLAAFDNNILIGHLYSGDLNTGVSDDIHRAAITLYSSIQFCSCMESTENTIRLMRSAGLVPDANYVGATHFNNIDISKISDIETLNLQPYILILINSEAKGDDEKLVEETLLKLKYFFPDEHPCKFNFVIAKGNGDNESIETEIFRRLLMKPNVSISIIKESRKDHEFFLSLIKYCSMFITNSSAAIYEAPALLRKESIIMVGRRNKERTPISMDLAHDGKASHRVAQLVKTFLESRT